jgi:anaerobic magnesium-protoporphyrin IX monomethyl ester cyclase
MNSHKYYQNGTVNETMYNEYGFFRNLYLFRTSVRLIPDEIHDITKTVRNLQSIAKLRYPKRMMIEYAHHEPMMFFPKDLISFDKTGLTSLCEVAYPRKPTLPLRHIGTS